MERNNVGGASDPLGGPPPGANDGADTVNDGVDAVAF
jgi:hypothetical protein